MIYDHIRNVRLYKAISPELATALDFLERQDIADMPIGRHDIDGARVYAMVQEYITKQASEAKWEAHKKYIDVQVIIAGKEKIGIAFTPSLHKAGPFDEERDFQLLEGKGATLPLTPGFFVVLGPDDAHQPGIACGRPAKVKKIVLKVAVAT